MSGSERKLDWVSRLCELQSKVRAHQVANLTRCNSRHRSCEDVFFRQVGPKTYLEWNLWRDLSTYTLPGTLRLTQFMVYAVNGNQKQQAKIVRKKQFGYSSSILWRSRACPVLSSSSSILQPTELCWHAAKFM